MINTPIWIIGHLQLKPLPSYKPFKSTPECLMSQISLQLKKNTIKGRSKMTFWAPQLQHVGGNISIRFFFLPGRRGQHRHAGRWRQWRRGRTRTTSWFSPPTGRAIPLGKEEEGTRVQKNQASRGQSPGCKSRSGNRKTFQRCNSISSTESVDRSPIYICP